ncbi:hypothetical protein [Alistipes ihumii]|uniref:hypothetical protein n=1 Tax=Alistipes ihumii TaxID=1470347 RepID=UPI003991EDA6
MNEDIIPIDSEIKIFSDYLDHNCRCILSARFGDGKSFFLNEVKKTLSDKYVFLTIYPVNYQVAENKDVFEYIKRDILLQILMTSEIELADEKYSFPLRLWGFLSQKSKDLLSDIIALVASSLANIPQTGMTILRDNIAKFKDFSKKINESESDSIESYLDEFTKQKGSVYEFDPISQIIYQLITDIKEKEHKQVVLVIEDMDRIDPAHLFRILNVFSAHWDIQDYSEQKLTCGNPQNKYNFDKILLVCHFQNVRNIFHHFYGEKTDFTGYIHKFSSSTPYEYSLKEVIEEWLLDKIPFNKNNFPDICKTLVTLIMQKYENSENIITNIRHIVNFFTQPSYNIKNEIIPRVDALSRNSYHISTSNQVTQLLCILENFQILIDDFLDCLLKDQEVLYWQMCRFIGQCWVIYPALEKNSNIRFSIVNSSFIECEKDSCHVSLPCTAEQISSNPFFAKYEIKDMQMDNVFFKDADFQPLFKSKQCYSTILSFFNEYIY